MLSTENISLYNIVTFTLQLGTTILLFYVARRNTKEDDERREQKARCKQHEKDISDINRKIDRNAANIRINGNEISHITGKEVKHLED